MEKIKRDLIGSGFLYVATGEKYIIEAENSAKTLKKVSPESQICLITDKEIKNELFDIILIIGFQAIEEESWKANLIYKIVGIQNSPFEKTLFIDTDMYFVHSVDEVFKVLDNFDLLACLDYYDQSKVKDSDGEIIPVYTPYNTGMLFYRHNERVTKFLEDWKYYYEKGIESYWSDQPAFMESLIYNDIKMYILHSSFNFRFLFNVGFLENEKIRIIHGRATQEEFHIIATRVNNTLSQRVWVASLRKCFSWNASRKDRLLRGVYSVLPAFLKSFLRSMRGLS